MFQSRIAAKDSQYFENLEDVLCDSLKISKSPTVTSPKYLKEDILGMILNDFGLIRVEVDKITVNLKMLLYSEVRSVPLWFCREDYDSYAEKKYSEYLAKCMKV